MSKTVEVKSKFDALYIEPLALRKIQYWTDAADGEVSGLGIVENEDGKMIVKEAYILEQECSAADTELKPEAVSKLMTDIIKDGKDPGKLKFWWHSHVNMGTFWSGTDDECAETLSTEYAFSLVVNKAKDRRARLDLYNPFRITVDHIRLVELSEEDKDLKKKCEDEVKEKVKSKSYSYSPPDSYHKGRHRSKNWYREGYFGGDYNGFDYDEYPFRENHDGRPKNWGKRIKLPAHDIDDITRLMECVKQWSYTDIAINDYITNTMRVVMKAVYEEKARCQDGPGEYWPENEVCKKCDIESICKILSEKFGDDIYEGENIVEDIDITSDKDKETGAVEVIVDSDERSGDRNG